MIVNPREGDLLAGVGAEEGRPHGPPNQLIASDRVEGTAVYNLAGDKIGTVRRFQVEKRTGQALYAEMAFGGFLGIGQDVHPIPWALLDYEVERGGYVVDITREQLATAPRHGEANPRPIDAGYDAEIRGYYGLPPI